MKLQMRLKTKGQSMVIIGILIGTGVLIGLVALAFDGGSAMLQRRNMQNGADSASLGTAKMLAAPERRHFEGRSPEGSRLS